MGREIDSDSLLRMNRILGLGKGGSSQTELDDAVVSQVVDITPVVRRSRTQAQTTGLWYFVQEHVHAGAGGLGSNWSPYDAVGNINAFPRPVPEGLDFWIIGFSGRRTAGAGGLTAAEAVLNVLATQQAGGIDDGGTAVASAAGIPLAIWDSIDAAGSQEMFLTEAGQPFVPLPMRMPRGANIGFGSEAAAAATFLLQGLCGLFPEGLGQDIWGAP